MRRLEKILCQLHPEINFSGDERLIDDGILDSLDMVTLVTDINDEYNIDIGAEDIVKENFNTVSCIASLIRRCGGDIICR